MLVGLARVSGRDQNVTLQIDALEAAGCEKVFVEHVSGVSDDRPQLDAALEFMRPGDTLVVWRLDRLARSLKQLLSTVDTLQRRGIAFKSVTENLDTSTHGGILVFQLFGAVAEFERNLIRERSRAGLEAARARGRVGGRPRKLSSEDIKAAEAMLAHPHVAVRSVADRLGVSVATLYRRVGRPGTAVG